MSRERREGSERILLHDLVLSVSTEERIGVVAAVADDVRRRETEPARKVVRAEAEEFCRLRDFISVERTT